MMIIQVTLTQFTTPKLTVTVKVNLMQAYDPDGNSDWYFLSIGSDVWQ